MSRPDIVLDRSAAAARPSSRRTGSAGRWIGIERSPDGIEVCRERLAGAGLRRDAGRRRLGRPAEPVDRGRLPGRAAADPGPDGAPGGHGSTVRPGRGQAQPGHRLAMGRGCRTAHGVGAEARRAGRERFGGRGGGRGGARVSRRADGGVRRVDGAADDGAAAGDEVMGSIYLHCDPTANAYLRLLMDAVFGRKRVSGTRSCGSERL